MHNAKFQRVGQLSRHRQRSQTWFNAPWGLLAASAIGLLAIWLTVARGLPFGHDSAHHIYRLVERDYLIRQGLFFTRWSPFFGGPYGAPLYNYYQPLLDYLAEPFMLLGLGPLVALRLTLGFALMGGALSMYCWVNELFGVSAGLVATMAYLFSPYVMYTLVNRAGFAEIIAFGLMPWGLWALRRYASDYSWSNGVRVTLIVAAILLAHVFTAFLFLATLLLYIPILAVGRPLAQHHLLNAITLGWPIGLGLGLAAFFWLPVIGEIKLTSLGMVPPSTVASVSGDQGLLPLWQIFAGPVLPDPFAPVATIPPRLSWFAAGLAVVGVVTGLTALRSARLKFHLVVGALTTTMMVFMITPSAHLLWQIIPLLHFQTLPFRFLGVASLWQAPLAGAGAAALLAMVHKPDGWHQRMAGVMVGGLCLILGLYALSWPAVAYHSPNFPATLAAGIQYERAVEARPPIGEQLPTSTKPLPVAPTAPGVGEPRLETNSLPGGARQLAAQYDLLNYKLTLDSPQPFQLVIKTLYFAGWAATIDGEPVSITPTSAYKLISLPVPAGQHVIEIRFGSTPIRIVADLISLLSIVCLAGLFVKMFWRPTIAEAWPVGLTNLWRRPTFLTKEEKL